MYTQQGRAEATVSPEIHQTPESLPAVDIPISLPLLSPAAELHGDQHRRIRGKPLSWRWRTRQHLRISFIRGTQSRQSYLSISRCTV